MNIKVHLLSQSNPVKYTDVKNTYTKDGLYCVYKNDGTVDKFPLVNIFRITENYSDNVSSVSHTIVG